MAILMGGVNFGCLCQLVGRAEIGHYSGGGQGKLQKCFSFKLYKKCPVQKSVWVCF